MLVLRSRGEEELVKDWEGFISDLEEKLGGWYFGSY